MHIELFLIAALIIVMVVAVLAIQYNRKSYLNNMDTYRANTDEWYQRYQNAHQARIEALDALTKAERERDDLRNNYENARSERDALRTRQDNTLADLTGLEATNAELKSDLDEMRGDYNRLVDLPKCAYKMRARVLPNYGAVASKIIKQSLVLEFVGPDEDFPNAWTAFKGDAIEVRTLAASKKNKETLDDVARLINNQIEKQIDRAA